LKRVARKRQRFRSDDYPNQVNWIHRFGQMLIEAKFKRAL